MLLYPNPFISNFFCADIAGLIHSYLFQTCQRCKQIKDFDLFKRTKTGKRVQICNECSATVKNIKRIKKELSEEIENQGINAPVRDGDILKVTFDRHVFDFALFEKTVKNYMQVRYPNLQFSVYDDMNEFYKVRIVDPNHIRYRTDQYFRKNFINMKDNPQTAFQVTQMDQLLTEALGFPNIKKIKIETEMFVYILMKITEIGWNLRYAVESKRFGKFKKQVDKVRSMAVGDARTRAIEDLTEKIELDMMKTIDLPANCTVLQLLRIIDTNWPKMYNGYSRDKESYWIDSFSLDKKENGDVDVETVVINWAC